MIGISEGINVKKSNGSCECIICHYWYFFEIIFRFQPNVCNDCHDLIQAAMIFNDIAIISVKGNDYRFFFCIRVKMKP